MCVCVVMPQFQLVAPAGENAGGPLSHSLWHPHLYEFTFNLTTGEMTRTPLAPGLSSDMPAIDRSLTGTASLTSSPTACHNVQILKVLSQMAQRSA